MPKLFKSSRSKKIRNRKTNTKKYIKRNRGGMKTKEQIQQEWIKGATPITNPIELNRLDEADRIAEERERNDNEIKRINAELERQRINTITSFPTTPMSQADIRRQNREDELHNKRVNSAAAKSRKLTLADLGGSKRRKQKKSKRTKKNKKQKKITGGNRIGGNNIGANCNDPNFSIYNTNLLKLFPYKGGRAIPPESNMELLQSPEEEERQQIEQQRLENERQQLENEEDNNNMEISDIDLNELDNIRRENIHNEFIRGDHINREPANLDNAFMYDSDMEPLRLSDLGGSNKKNNRKDRKTRKTRKIRKNKKRVKKGGELQADDIYKNSEGPQF